MKKLILFLALLTAMPAFAQTTYYIDYSTGSDLNSGLTKLAPWQHAGGMVGASNNANSHVPVPGDIYIFKGGVTWPVPNYPWIFPSSGTSGSHITYTTDHTWFNGGSFTQPTFDDNHALTANNAASPQGYIQVPQSGITVNDFNFINYGTAHAKGGNACIDVHNQHDETWTNNTFACYARIPIYIHWDSVSGTFSNILLNNNDFSHANSATWIATASSNITVDNVQFNNNLVHDFHDQIGGGNHGDGIHVFNAPDSDTTQKFTHFQMCNNRFFGDFTIDQTITPTGLLNDMSGFIFVEDNTDGIICNNDLSYFPLDNTPSSSIFQAPVLIFGTHGAVTSSTLIIANNSVFGGSPNNMSAGIDLGNQPQHVTLYNNISSRPNITGGMAESLFVEDTTGQTGLVADNNLWNCNFNAIDLVNVFTSYPTWQGLGFDPHGKFQVDPKWVGAPGNEQLLAGSPAIAAGKNLTSLGFAILNADINGNPRPTVGAWDMGAYNFGAGAPSVSFSPASLSFGSAIMYQTVPTSGQVTTTLTNTGSSALVISSVTITGASASQFALVTPLSGSDCRSIGTVSPGLTCVLAATATPTAQGAISASISMADNAAGSPQTVPLSVTGLAVPPAPAPTMAGLLTGSGILLGD